MKHRLYLPTFLPVSFPDAREPLLEDMTKKGWFLKKAGYFLSFCQFEKGTPAPVRYRLEPIPDTVRTPSAEIVQFFSSKNHLLVVHYYGDASLKDYAEDFPELFAQTYTPLQERRA